MNRSHLHVFLFITLQLGHALVLDGNTVLRMGPWTTGCWRYIPECVNGMSLALWLKVTQIPTWNNRDHGIISTLNSGKGNGFFLAIWTFSGDLEIGFGIFDPNDGLYKLFTVSPISTGSWHHYVFDITYDTENPIFNGYFDSITKSSSIWSVNKGFSPSDTFRDVIVFGNMYADYPNSYMPSVMIDEVLMFNYTLTLSVQLQCTITYRNYYNIQKSGIFDNI